MIAFLRVIGFLLVCLLLLIAGIAVFFVIKDYPIVRQVPEHVEWIENFYTANSRFPSKAEFESQFPGVLSSNPHWHTGTHYRMYGDQESAQHYYYSYPISHIGKWLGIADQGSPFTGVLGYEGYYTVDPCPRWADVGLGDSYPHDAYVYPPEGLIRSNFHKGTIYFWDSKINTEDDWGRLLMSGFVHPRVMQKDGSNVIITNGPDVLSYAWDSVAMKLVNPQRIGEVPTGCPARE
ncbi:MAG: hypothetical protein G01um10148_256 [Parcubacteria group bacterium Gr01-1014_8]|nr:MAG: hypothetical protein G01um10148_256 [Parcubacteria group bacterium Gr01-1014_8]